MQQKPLNWQIQVEMEVWIAMLKLMAKFNFII